MATVREVDNIIPFEYEDWRYKILLDEAGSVHETYIEHIHKHDKQYIRWMTVKGVETLACFICGKRLPVEVYTYFERCRELIECAMK